MAHKWARKKRKIIYKKKLLKSNSVKSKTQSLRQASPILTEVKNDPKRLKETSHKLFSTPASSGNLQPLRKKILKKTWSKNLQRWVSAMYNKNSRIGITLPNGLLVKIGSRVSFKYRGFTLQGDVLSFDDSRSLSIAAIKVVESENAVRAGIVSSRNEEDGSWVARIFTSDITQASKSKINSNPIELTKILSPRRGRKLRGQLYKLPEFVKYNLTNKLLQEGIRRRFLAFSKLPKHLWPKELKYIVKIRSKWWRSKPRKWRKFGYEPFDIFDRRFEVYSKSDPWFDHAKRKKALPNKFRFTYIYAIIPSNKNSRKLLIRKPRWFRPRLRFKQSHKRKIYVGKTGPGALITRFIGHIRDHYKDVNNKTRDLYHLMRSNGPENIVIVPLERVYIPRNATKNKIDAMVAKAEGAWIHRLRTCTPTGLNSKKEGLHELQGRRAAWNMNKRKLGRKMHFGTLNVEAQIPLIIQNSVPTAQLTRLYQSHNWKQIAFDLLPFAAGHHKQGAAETKLNDFTMSKLKSVLEYCMSPQDKVVLRPLFVLITSYMVRKIKMEVSIIDPKKFVMKIPFLDERMRELNLERDLWELMDTTLPDLAKKDKSNLVKLFYTYGTPNYVNLVAGKQIALMGKLRLLARQRAKQGRCCGFCEEPGNKKFFGHDIQSIATADLGVLRDIDLQAIVERGLNFRREGSTNWLNHPEPTEGGNEKSIHHHVEQSLKSWSSHVSENFGLNEDEVKRKIEATALRFESKIKSLDNEAGISEKEAKRQSVRGLGDPSDCENFWMIDPKNCQAPLAILPMDKFGGRAIIVCKVWYRLMLLRDLESSKSYKEYTDETEQQIVDRLNSLSTSKGFAIFNDDDAKNKPRNLAYAYATIKVHKLLKPPSIRLIFGGRLVPTTPISNVTQVACRAILNIFDQVSANMWLQRVGFGPETSTVVQTTDKFLEHIEKINTWGQQGKFDMKNCAVGTSDFTKLYPSIPTDDLIRKVSAMIRFAYAWYKLVFNRTKKQDTPVSRSPCIVVGQFPCKEAAYFAPNRVTAPELKPGWTCLDPEQLIEAITIVIQNCYCKFDGKIWKVVRGFPIGTNNAPELANIYLLYYEITFFNRQLKKWNSLSESMRIFLLFYKRYIDDLFWGSQCDQPPDSWLYKSGKNDGIFPLRLKDSDGSWVDKPLELTGTFGDSVNYLDTTVFIMRDIGRLAYNLYDKRHNLIVNGVQISKWPNFPDKDSMVSESCKLGVVTSQLHRFCRRTSSASNFRVSALTLVHKMLLHGYEYHKIIRKVRRFEVHWRPELGRWNQQLFLLLKGMKEIWLTLNFSES